MGSVLAQTDDGCLVNYDTSENGNIEEAQEICTQDQVINAQLFPFLDVDYYSFKTDENVVSQSIDVSIEFDEVGVQEFVDVLNANENFNDEITEMAQFQIFKKSLGNEEDSQMIRSYSIGHTSLINNYSFTLSEGEYFLKLRAKPRLRGEYSVSLDFGVPEVSDSVLDDESPIHDIKALVLMVKQSEKTYSNNEYQFFRPYLACIRLLGPSNAKCNEYQQAYEDEEPSLTFDNFPGFDEHIAQNALEYYEHVSNGKITIEADFIDWFDVDDICQLDRTSDDLSQILSTFESHPEYGTDAIHTQFNHLMIVFPHVGGAPCTKVGSHAAYDKIEVETLSKNNYNFEFSAYTSIEFIRGKVLEHEMAHNMGGRHSLHLLDCPGGVLGDPYLCNDIHEYGAPNLSLLGARDLHMENDLHTLNKLNFDWISHDNVKTISSRYNNLIEYDPLASATDDEIFTVESFYANSTELRPKYLLEIDPPNIVKVRIPIHSHSTETNEQRYFYSDMRYYVEHRSEGALIYLGNKSQFRTASLDLYDDGIYQQSYLLQGQAYVDDRYGVRIEILSHNEDSLTLRVNSLEVESIDYGNDSNNSDDSETGQSDDHNHQEDNSTSNDTEPDDEPTTNEIYPLPVSGLEETDFAAAQTVSAPSYNVNTSNQKFAFTPSVRGLHTLYSSGSVAIDKVWLIDPIHNDQRILDYDEEQSATGQNFRVGNVLETDRTYYLYVEYQAGANGTYGIEIIEPVNNSDSYGLNDDHSNRLPGDLTDQPYPWFDSRDATNMTAGQTKTGVIDTQVDVDVFRVTLPVEHMSTSYQVSISSDAPVTYIKESCGVIFDDSQAPVYSVDGSYAHEFIYRAGITPLPEDFEFCVVMQGTAGANYTLEAGRVFPELGADDFGNTIQKSSLVTNGWVTGATQTDGDVDVFRYEPSTSGDVMVELKTPDFSPGVSMMLLDASGNEIPNSFRQSNGIAVAPAIIGQNIYVQVQGAVSGVTYHLTVGDEDYMNSSTSLPVNPVVVSDLGSVSDVYSVDADGRPTKFYYQFAVAETGDYELKINQPDEAKSFLTVYDDNYQVIAGRESYAGFDHVVYPHLEAGKPYVVSLWRGHSINLIDLPFDFDLVKLQTALVDESDRFDQPETLQSGVETQGMVNEWEDVDVYSFVASQDGAVNVIATVPSGASYTLYQRATGQQITSRFALSGELLVTSGSLSVKAGEEVQMVIFTDYAAEIGSKYGFRFLFSPGAPSTVPYPTVLPPESHWPLVNYGVPKLVDFSINYSVSHQGFGWFYVDQDKSFDVNLMNGGRFILLDNRKDYVTHGFAGLSQVDLEEGAYYLYLSRAAGETGDFDLRVEPTNIEPTLSFETSSLDQVFVGTPVSFNLSNSVDPDGSIVSYDWIVNGEVHPDFTGDVVSYGFDTTGDYTVEVTITDDRGAQVSESVSFTVEDRPDGDGTPALARELGPYPYSLYQMDYYFLSYYINNSSVQIEYVGDVDFFTFVPTRTGRASIFTNSSLATLGKLYDENQNLVEVSEYKRTDNNFFISAVLEANKRYYVSVESEAAETGDYYLYVQKSADDHEPSLSMATPLTEGEEMDASLSYSPSYGYDVDSFRFVPEESGDYIFGSYSNNGAIEYDFSADDNYAFQDGNTSAGQMNVTRSLQAGQTYFVKLRIEIGNSTQYDRSTQAGIYIIKAKDDHPDLQMAATSLTENISVSGQVDDAEDIDWFRVPRRYVYPGELYSVVYTGSSSAELVIGTNTVVLTSGEARNINDSIGSYNTPVYVKVSGAVGSYLVEFIKESDDHGDNEAAATTMGLQTINGKIGTPGDVDVFKYTHSGYYCQYVNVQMLSGTSKTISRYNNRIAQTWMPTNTTYFYEYMCPGNYMYLRIQDAAGGTGDYSFRVY